MDLLDTRSQTPVTGWLKNHPEIKLITRDGSKTYAKAVTEASYRSVTVGIFFTSFSRRSRKLSSI